MRLTLHLAAGEDYPAYAQLDAPDAHAQVAQGRSRTSTRSAVAASWRAGCASRARTTRSASASARYEGVADDLYGRSSSPARCCRSCSCRRPGYWRDRRRPRFVVDPRPLPEPADAAALVLARYLAAFGPASRRDVAAWAGVAQRDFAEAWERVDDGLLPRRATASSCSTCPTSRCRRRARAYRCASCARWDQTLLAYADRDRIIPPELLPLKLDAERRPDGHRRRPRRRVAGSSSARKRAVKVVVQPHVEIRRSALAADPLRGETHRALRASQRRPGWRS